MFTKMITTDKNLKGLVARWIKLVGEYTYFNSERRLRTSCPKAKALSRQPFVNDCVPYNDTDEKRRSLYSSDSG